MENHASRSSGRHVWGKRVYVATAVKPGEAELKVGLYGDITPLEEKEIHQ